MAQSLTRAIATSIKIDAIIEHLVPELTIITYVLKYFLGIVISQNSRLLRISNNRKIASNVRRADTNKPRIVPRLGPVERNQIPDIFKIMPMTANVDTE